MVIRLTGEHHKLVAPASVHSMMGNQALYVITNDELREHVLSDNSKGWFSTNRSCVDISTFCWKFKWLAQLRESENEMLIIVPTSLRT